MAKKTALLLALLALLVVTILAAEPTVIELTEKNFQSKTSDGGVWLVEFYGPQCGHCKLLQPNYDALAKKVAKEGWKFKVAKVNTVENPQVTATHSAYPWPSVKLFKNGKHVTSDDSRGYHGDDGVRKLLSFVKSKHPEVAPVGSNEL